MPARKGKREATKVEQSTEVEEQAEPPVKKSRAKKDVEKKPAKAVPKKKTIARGKKAEAEIKVIVEAEGSSNEENNVEEEKKSPKGKKKAPMTKKTTDKDINIEKRETRGSKAKKEAEPAKVQTPVSIKGKSAKTNQKSKK